MTRLNEHQQNTAGQKLLVNISKIKKRDSKKSDFSLQETNNELHKFFALKLYLWLFSIRTGLPIKNKQQKKK